MERLYTYFMNFPQIVPTVLFFFGAGCLSFIFQIMRNRREFSFRDMLKHCVPFDVFRSKSFHMDVKMHFIHRFTDFIFYSPGWAILALVATLVVKSMSALAPHYTAGHFSYSAAFICIVVITLTVEFSDYIVHYAEHKIPALWELHKVHHSADFINPLTAKRDHSFQLLYSGVSGGVIVGATIGGLMFLFNIGLIEAIALKSFASKLVNVSTLSPLKHSHIPVGFGWFDKIFISPHMHQVHHSKLRQHWDKNFGNNLSIYDWLFNTGYKPARGEQVVFGIAGYSDAELQQFNTLFGALVSPVLRAKDRIWKGTGAEASTAPNKPGDSSREIIPPVSTAVRQLPRTSMSLDPPTMVIHCYRGTKNQENTARNLA